MTAENQDRSSSVEALLEIARIFNPKRHEAVWLAAAVGKCSLQSFGSRALTPLKSLRGKLTVADLNRFLGLGLIKVTKRQDEQTLAFLPTRRLLDVVASGGPIPIEWSTHGVSSPKDQDATPLQPIRGGTNWLPSGLVGRILGARYKIERHMSSGGMGDVYQAHDEKMNRRVAIKTIKASVLGVGKTSERFDREAATLARLNHPNIVTLLETGVVDKSGEPYLVFEYVDGVNLDLQIKTRPLTVSVAATIVQQIAKGLASAHAIGVWHRDLKPANVMVLKDHTAKILDFGIAALSRPLGEAQDTIAALTKSTEMLGTPGYMAPEQIDGGAVDLRADIFSIGVILYYSVSGQQPFKKTTVKESLAATIRDAPPTLDELLSGLPGGFSMLVGNCLEKDRERRPGSALEVVERLTPYLSFRPDPQAEPAVIDRTVTMSAGTLASSKEQPTPDDWVVIESLFSRVDGEVDAHWVRYLADGVVVWNVHPQTAKVGKRTVGRFLNEARTAGQLLKRMSLGAQQGHEDLADHWLDAVLANIDPISRVHMSGHDERGDSVGGTIESAVHASMAACAHFASLIRLGGASVSAGRPRVDVPLQSRRGGGAAVQFPDLSLQFDPGDPNCVSGGRREKFAIRVAKSAEGRARDVSVVLDSVAVDGRQRVCPPNRRLPLLGVPLDTDKTNVSPGVPQYFRILHQIDHAGNQSQGEATWQLHAQGEREYLHGNELELGLRLESDLITRGVRIRFQLRKNDPPLLEFEGLQTLDP